MKLFKAILISLWSVLLMGCIGDDTDACIKSCTLHFNYINFPDHINKVNVGIFDADGLFVTAQVLDKQTLSAFQGVRLNLTGGKYVAVCWGNAFDNTQIEGWESGINKLEGSVFHPYLHASRPISSNDSLYYGKHNFAVQENIPVQDTIAFVPAHIKLQIQVKGLLNTTATTPEADYPFIRINNLLPVYDFEMQTLGHLTSYYPSVHIDTSARLVHARCDVLRFGNDTPVTIDVVENTTTNKIHWTVNLREFIQKNDIVIKDSEEISIPILIAFQDGKVDVSLTGWEGTPTEPNL